MASIAQIRDYIVDRTIVQGLVHSYRFGSTSGGNFRILLATVLGSNGLATGGSSADFIATYVPAGVLAFVSPPVGQDYLLPSDFPATTSNPQVSPAINQDRLIVEWTEYPFSKLDIIWPQASAADITVKKEINSQRFERHLV